MSRVCPCRELRGTGVVEFRRYRSSPVRRGWRAAERNEAKIDLTSAQRPGPLQRHRFRAPLPQAAQLYHPP
ncbi:uncharacterized [Tachysurus ichikawai]